jgi:hypothetical protein
VIGDAIQLFLVMDRCVDRLARFRSIIPAVAGVVAVLFLALIGMSLPEKIRVSVIVLLSFKVTARFALLAADAWTAIQV